MSRENVDLALRLYDAFNRRDLKRFLGLMHEEAEVGRGGVDQRLGMVATVRDGRIVHTKVFRDPEDALEAVGLQE